MAGLQLGMELLGEGGPVGVVLAVGAAIAMPVIALVNKLRKPSVLKKMDDNPEKVYSSQFAWVRSYDPEHPDAPPKWYPGIVAERDPRMYGPLLRINYGPMSSHNLDGTFTAHFMKPRYKLFNPTAEDLKYTEGSKSHYKDPVRDFKLMSKEESQKLFSQIVTGKDISNVFQEHNDDRSKLPKYEQDLLQWRDYYEYARPCSVCFLPIFSKNS